MNSKRENARYLMMRFSNFSFDTSAHCIYQKIDKVIEEINSMEHFDFGLYLIVRKDCFYIGRRVIGAPITVDDNLFFIDESFNVPLSVEDFNFIKDDPISRIVSDIRKKLDLKTNSCAFFELFLTKEANNRLILLDFGAFKWPKDMVL